MSAAREVMTAREAAEVTADEAADFPQFLAKTVETTVNFLVDGVT